MPLGVFAVTTKEEETEPSMYMQLAVSKDGIISGTYYNSATDSGQPIQGAVDPETQRAAWTIGDNKTTVVETGVYNLTQDETPILVHFGTDRTQQWFMARLEEPEESSATSE